MRRCRLRLHCRTWRQANRGGACVLPRVCPLACHACPCGKPACMRHRCMRRARPHALNIIACMRLHGSAPAGVAKRQAHGAGVPRTALAVTGAPQLCNGSITSSACVTAVGNLSSAPPDSLVTLSMRLAIWRKGGEGRAGGRGRGDVGQVWRPGRRRRRGAPSRSQTPRGAGLDSHCTRTGRPLRPLYRDTRSHEHPLAMPAGPGGRGLGGRRSAARAAPPGAPVSPGERGPAFLVCAMRVPAGCPTREGWESRYPRALTTGRPSRRVQRLDGQARQVLRQRLSGAGEAGDGGLGHRLFPDVAPTSLPPPRTQAVEKRFMNWADNLKFALDFNARSSSHWVRAARCARVARRSARAQQRRAAPCSTRILLMRIASSSSHKEALALFRRIEPEQPPAPAPTLARWASTTPAHPPRASPPARSASTPWPTSATRSTCRSLASAPPASSAPPQAAACRASTTASWTPARCRRRSTGARGARSRRSRTSSRCAPGRGKGSGTAGVMAARARPRAARHRPHLGGRRRGLLPASAPAAPRQPRGARPSRRGVLLAPGGLRRHMRARHQRARPPLMRPASLPRPAPTPSAARAGRSPPPAPSRASTRSSPASSPR